MIRTLYRAASSDVPSPVFDPLDPLEGAVPSWRIGDAGEPEWLTVVALLGDPFAVRVDVEVVEVSGSSRLDEVEETDGVVVDLPTRALTLRAVEDEPLPDPCPDCHAAGLDPCRPKSNPAGRPLTRWHRRRRLLLERDAGRGGVALLVVIVILVLAVATGVGATLRTAVQDLQRPCPVPTLADCEVGP